MGGGPPAIAQDRLAVCDQIEEEVVRVLTRKFGWEVERVRADLAFYWLEGFSCFCNSRMRSIAASALLRSPLL